MQDVSCAIRLSGPHAGCELCNKAQQAIMQDVSCAIRLSGPHAGCELCNKAQWPSCRM